MLLEYNGAGFKGWQVQPGQRTVQGELEATISKVLRHSVRLTPSGRTDSGVHARGQVASFETPHGNLDLVKLQRSVSAMLRGELAVLRINYVADTFHPRKGVVKKRYRYILERRYVPPVLDAGRVWHVYDDMDLDLFRQQAGYLIGRHNFTTFRAAGCDIASPEKTIYTVSAEEVGSKLIFTIVGSGFLKHMVRIIVGTLVDIARGSLSASVPDLLQEQDRTKAGITAPAYGLEMMGVRYAEHSYGWLDLEGEYTLLPHKLVEGYDGKEQI